MDEQQHRRRRQYGQPVQPQEEHEAPVRGVENPEPPSDELQQAHHRRRRHQQAAGEQKPVQEVSPLIDEESVFYDPYAHQVQEKPEQAAKKPLPRPLRALSSMDQLVCRIGDFCLEAIKWTGVAALFAAGFAADGAKRLIKKAKPVLRSDGRKKLSSVVHTGKRIKRPEKVVNTQDEVTIVAVRPEDYKGMGERRSHRPHHGLPHAQPQRKRVVRAPKKKVSPVYSAAMTVLICVALVSTYMISSILWRSISTKRLSNSLSERYSQLSGEQSAVTEALPSGAIAFMTEDAPTPTSTSTPTPEPEATPVSVQITPAPKKDTVRSTKYHQVGGDALPEMEALYQDNRDLTGWLRMEGILDLPVVYKDNSYYLTRDFYKNKSASGTLFLDENHPFREDAQNLLLHGHNMKDGTMFGRLVQYETNLQFLKNNPFIQYSTLWKKEQYVIFAVLHVSLDVKSEEFFNYFTHHTFSSDTQFENYVRALKNRSVFSIPVNVDPSDALLTLSTCLDEDRLVIVARRVRNGESKSDLRHQVQLAARQ